jgi:hypothetical protein
MRGNIGAENRRAICGEVALIYQARVRNQRDSSHLERLVLGWVEDPAARVELVRPLGEARLEPQERIAMSAASAADVKNSGTELDGPVDRIVKEHFRWR